MELLSPVMVFPKEFFKKIEFEKNQQTTKNHEKISQGAKSKVYLYNSVIHTVQINFQAVDVNKYRYIQTPTF